MHHHIVEGDPAGQRVLQYMTLLLRILAEVVKRQRTWPRVDLRDDLIKVVIAQHDHGRTEDFLVHDQAVRRRIDHHPQRTTTVLGIHGQGFGQALDARTA
ncbi:hypothetical protein D3C76_933810 [compost metagenome]